MLLATLSVITVCLPPRMPSLAQVLPANYYRPWSYCAWISIPVLVPLFKNSLKIKIHNRLNLLNCLMLQKRSHSNLSVTITIYEITSTTGRTTSSLKDLYLNAGPPFLRTILTFINSGEKINSFLGENTSSYSFENASRSLKHLKNNSLSQRNA